jgi:hypothetical protein
MVELGQVVLFSIKFPGSLHELNEVVIVVNGGWDSRVVIIPFISLDLSISVFITEVSEELKEDLILSHLSWDNFGVEAGVVNTLQVSSFNAAITVLIKLEESLVGHSLSLGVHFTLLKRLLSTISHRK